MRGQPAPEQAVAPRTPARRPQATPQTPGQGGVWQELGAGGLLGGRGGEGSIKGGVARSQVTSVLPGRASRTKGPGGETALEGSDAGVT